jgi:hypothetical protein
MKNTSKYITIFFIVLMSLIHIIVYYPSFSSLGSLIGIFLLPLIIALLVSKYSNKNADRNKKLIIFTIIYCILILMSDVGRIFLNKNIENTKSEPTELLNPLVTDFKIEFKLNDPLTTTLEDTNLTSKHIKLTRLEFNSSNIPFISIEFTDIGSKIFEDITKNNLGKRLFIFFEGEPIAIPEIKEPISNGRIIIEGQFTKSEAEEIVSKINKGLDS